MNKVPSHLKYTQDHEWAQIDLDIVTVGITDFAQSALGDIVYIELPEVGTIVEQGRPFGVVESIKSVSDLYAPITGEIIEVNNTIKDSPELVNADTYSSWFIKLKVSKKEQLKQLMEAKQYEDFCTNL